jgi:hypothetical protein
VNNNSGILPRPQPSPHKNSIRAFFKADWQPEDLPSFENAAYKPQGERILGIDKF